MTDDSLSSSQLKKRSNFGQIGRFNVSALCHWVALVDNLENCAVAHDLKMDLIKCFNSEEFAKAALPFLFLMCSWSGSGSGSSAGLTISSSSSSQHSSVDISTSVSVIMSGRRAA